MVEAGLYLQWVQQEPTGMAALWARQQAFCFIQRQERLQLPHTLFLVVACSAKYRKVQAKERFA